MSDPNKIQPPKKGIEMVKGGGYPAKAVSTSVQQHTAPIKTDMYLIGAQVVQWALIGLAFYAALHLFRSAVMDALGFRKSRKDAKEEDTRETVEMDGEIYTITEDGYWIPEGVDEQEYINDYITYMEDSELLEKSWERWEINASTALQEGHEYGSDEFYSRIAELEEMDRLVEEYEPSESDDEPPDNMPDSPEEDTGLQYDLDQHNQEVYDNSPQWYRDLVDSGQFDEEPEPVGPPTREEMAINLVSFDGSREMEDEDWEYAKLIAERLEEESPEDIEIELIAKDTAINEATDWEADSYSGKLSERIEQIKQELKQERQ